MQRIFQIIDIDPARYKEGTLAFMCTRGFYLLPGVQNTTHVTQSTDCKYGLFKTVYHNNLKKFAAYRQLRRETTKQSSMPLLIFGGSESNLQVRNTFEEAFAIEKLQDIWKTIGILPYTRHCLQIVK